MTDKPNIVFLVNDHQLYYRHGWDGGLQPQRPYFQRLAFEGVSFANAYTPCPLCMPARRTLLTGVFPHKHRILDNDETRTPADYQVYLSRLREAGYRNYYYGKWHAGPDTALDHDCEGYCYTGYGNPYLTQEYEDFLERRGLPWAEHLIERSLWPEDLQPGQLYRCEMEGRCDEHIAGITLTPKETHETFFLANLVCDKLREIAGESRPFSLRVDFWGPHFPYFPTREYANLYDPRSIPEYGNFRDDLSDKPRVYRTENNFPLYDDNEQIIVPSALPWSEWQKVIARCYAHITMVDAAGGIILDALDELGLTDSTAVIWTTDHGDALGCHGGHFDKRSYMPQEVLRIPMAVRWPGHIQAPQVSDRLVSLIDIAPTILDMAGTSFEHQPGGRSLVPLLAGTASDWRSDLMCETHGHNEAGIVGRAVVTDRYKYVATRGQMHELYDLVRDPYELNNLIDDEAYKGVESNLRERLLAWQEMTRDDEVSL
ncbi:MAG: sulfatase-like hydrolase/transferase [Chloroflexota bacterium]